MKKRTAFTMIELIFVIVILGILAAVAMPKLAATKGDAEAAVILESLADCIENASGSFMMDSEFDINSSSCNTATVRFECFVLSPDNNTGILNVKHSDSVDKECVNAQKIATFNRLSSNGGGIDHQF